MSKQDLSKIYPIAITVFYSNLGQYVHKGNHKKLWSRMALQQSIIQSFVLILKFYQLLKHPLTHVTEAKLTTKNQNTAAYFCQGLVWFL